MWFGLGGFLLAVGATLAWLVNVPVIALGPKRLGVFLMVCGVISLVVGVTTRVRASRASGSPDAPAPTGPPH